MKLRTLLKRGIIGLLCITTILSVTGCGGDKEANLNSEDAVIVGMPKLGYGTAWIEAMAERYNEKTGNNVVIKVDAPNINYAAMIQSGTGDYDIYCTRIASQQIVKSMGDEALLEDLTDLYKKQNPYDDNKTTIETKLKEGYRYYNEYVEADGTIRYYGLQYCDSIQTIVRNLKVWDDSWKEPATTDELLALCKTVKEDGGTPFIWCSADSYWQSFYPVWVYQYQGYEDMIEFWSGSSESGEKLSGDMWSRQGWLEALKVMEEILLPKNEYCDEYSRSVDFTSAQSYFIGGTRDIAMMVNGDWLTNEMIKNYPDAQLEMMKTPVLSAVINILPDKSVQDDAELSALIAAIDNKDTSLKGKGYEVTQNDYDYVKTCRTYYANVNGHHQFLIPVNSDQKEIAKDFLLFCASDEAMMLMAETSGGFLSPYQYTDEQINTIKTKYCTSDYMKSAVELRDGEVALSNFFRSKIFTLGGMQCVPRYNLTGLPEVIMSETGSGYMDASTIYYKNIGNVKAAWSTIMVKAGYR